jgi:hypothetical protein
VAQHGQVLKLHSWRRDGKARWAYRYRVDGSFSKRPQVGGFATRDEAQRALRRELARLRPGRDAGWAEHSARSAWMDEDLFPCKVASTHDPLLVTGPLLLVRAK